MPNQTVEWTPYDPDDKTAYPLPGRIELVWVFDVYYEGVTLATWTHNGDPSDGWWVGVTGQKDDIGVRAWMPLVKPEPPEDHTEEHTEEHPYG